MDTTILFIEAFRVTLDRSIQHIHTMQIMDRQSMPFKVNWQIKV